MFDHFLVFFFIIDFLSCNMYSYWVKIFTWLKKYCKFFVQFGLKVKEMYCNNT